MGRGLTWRDAGVAAGFLLLLALVLYGRHVTRGGFSADDWAYAETARYPGPSGAFTDVWNVAHARPVSAVYLGAILVKIGANSEAWLSIALGLGVIASVLLYAVLRTLGLSRLQALIVAALGLTFPLSDSTILWFGASLGQLAIAFYFAGLLLALRGVRGGRPLLSATHLVSLALFALSIMSYEITAPVIAVSVVLYLLVAPRRAALRRWACDVAVAVAVVSLVTAPSTPTTVDVTLSFLFAHVKLILGQGSTVFSQSLFPFYGTPERRVTTTVSVLVVLVGVWVLHSLARSETRRDLQRSLLTVAAGAVIALAGWAILIPGALGYSPGAAGNGNRINVMAAFGIVLMVYGLVRTSGILAFRGLSGAGRLVGSWTAVGCAIICLGYVYRVHQDVDVRDEAALQQTSVLAAVTTEFPHLPHGATVYITGYNPQTGVDIPVFELPFDLINAVRYDENDPSLSAWPIISPAHLVCGEAGTSLTAPSGPVTGEGAAYREAYFVSYQPRVGQVIDSRASCERITSAR